MFEAGFQVAWPHQYSIQTQNIFARTARLRARSFHWSLFLAPYQSNLCSTHSSNGSSKRVRVYACSSFWVGFLQGFPWKVMSIEIIFGISDFGKSLETWCWSWIGWRGALPGWTGLWRFQGRRRRRRRVGWYCRLCGDEKRFGHSRKCSVKSRHSKRGQFCSTA